MKKHQDIINHILRSNTVLYDLKEVTDCFYIRNLDTPEYKQSYLLYKYLEFLDFFSLNEIIDLILPQISETDKVYLISNLLGQDD